MKPKIYALLIIILILMSCGSNTSLNDDLPHSIEIYYKYNKCPWGETGIVWYPPKDFLDRSLHKITITDKKSLEFFKALRLKADSYGKTTQFTSKIWFCAIVNYETHTDTVSISGFDVLYNEKGFQDSTTVFHYINKIHEEDSITFSKLDELFYYNDFHFISKEIYDKFSGETHEVNIGLSDKIKEHK